MVHSHIMIAQRALASLLTIASIFVVPVTPLLAEDAPEPEAPVPAVRTVSLTIRDGVGILWNGNASVPDSDSATTSIIATDGTVAEARAADPLSAVFAAGPVAADSPFFS